VKTSNLPYSKVETFDLWGKVYPTEHAALQAAIEELVGNHGIAATVIAKACDLSPLLARVCELGASPS